MPKIIGPDPLCRVAIGERNFNGGKVGRDLQLPSARPLRVTWSAFGHRVLPARPSWVTCGSVASEDA
jgi:hypothetical protein